MKIFRRSTFINFAMRLGEKIEKGGGGRYSSLQNETLKLLKGILTFLDSTSQ